jgi:hypothetical protein
VLRTPAPARAWTLDLNLALTHTHLIPHPTGQTTHLPTVPTLLLPLSRIHERASALRTLLLKLQKPHPHLLQNRHRLQLPGLKKTIPAR